MKRIFGLILIFCLILSFVGTVPTTAATALTMKTISPVNNAKNVKSERDVINKLIKTQTDKDSYAKSTYTQINNLILFANDRTISNFDLTDNLVKPLASIIEVNCDKLDVRISDDKYYSVPTVIVPIEKIFANPKERALVKKFWDEQNILRTMAAQKKTRAQIKPTLLATYKKQCSAVINNEEIVTTAGTFNFEEANDMAKFTVIKIIKLNEYYIRIFEDLDNKDYGDKKNAPYITNLYEKYSGNIRKANTITSKTLVKK